MHGNIEPIRPQPEPEVKYGVIMLTNRAPIQIDLKTWTIVAQGFVGEEITDRPWGWNIHIIIRKELGRSGRQIIHGEFNSWDDSEEAAGQKTGVGRLLWPHEVEGARLWKHLLEVGEEMRARIPGKHLHINVTLALDQCFASLPADDV